MRSQPLQLVTVPLFALATLLVFPTATWGQNPPRLAMVGVTGGGEQRSMVSALQFQFSADVSASIGIGDFSLLHRDQEAPLGFPDGALSYDVATQTATLRLVQPEGASLDDGSYRLTLKASGVTDASGTTLDSNGDGTAGDDLVFDFHRYFGDIDGDTDVDFKDLCALRDARDTARDNPAYLPGFDSDSDGDIDAKDISEFDLRYLSALPDPARGFRSLPQCFPLAGKAPLPVHLRTFAEFKGGSIVLYEWDFEGDGFYNTRDAVARDYDFTYNLSGTYNAALRVTNNLGQSAVGVCTIVVSGGPPTALANATPSNGPIPLDVNFNCVATDEDGTVVKYQWDFDGDGTFDFESASPTAQHTYTTIGDFEAVCRVTDNDGLTALARTTATMVRARPTGSPGVTGTTGFGGGVTATASGVTGAAPLSVNFNGSATGSTITLWEWDFEGDGTFDFSSPTSPATNHTYTEARIFTATLRATNNQGLTSSDTLEVNVRFTAGLRIAGSDTFDPSNGETAQVDTTTNAPAPVNVQLKNQSGALVRTLFDGPRAPGTHSDMWDGTDNDGLPLPEGPYYAILEYTIGGLTQQIDLTNTTGGLRYNPNYVPFPQPYPYIFRPLEDNMLEIEFTVPESRGASEILGFIGLFNVDTRFITLLERQPFGVGTQKIYWDGRTASGSPAEPPPGDSFLFGIWGFTLPDNVVYLKTAPTLSNVEVEPNVFGPSTPTYSSPEAPVALITYDLDKAADVVVSITNLETGATLRKIVKSNVAPGAGHQIAWNGRADNGLFGDKGDYRLTVQAFDKSGGGSLVRHTLIRVYH